MKFLPFLAFCLTVGFGGLPAGATPSAIILSDARLPHADPALAQSLAHMLGAVGYAPLLQTVDQIEAQSALAPQQCGLLVLPQAGELPASLAPAVTRYLHAGGHLIALGVPIWGTPLVRGDSGKWVTSAEYAESRALTPPPHRVADFQPGTGLSAWRRSSDHRESPTQHGLVTAMARGRSAGGLHVVIPRLDGYDTFASPDLTTPPFSVGQTMTVFSARGGPRTHSLAVEWDEKDGSRWIATVPLTVRWRYYSLPPVAFRSWGNTDTQTAAGFHPQDAVRFSVGLAFSHTGTVGGVHEYWVSEFGTASASEAPAIPDIASREPLETLTPSYKFFPIHGAVRLTAQTGTPSAPASLLSTQPRPGGAGFAKGRGWRWLPLLTATDSNSGEWRGAPASLMLHSAGHAFGGGAWAAFAIADPAFYRQPFVMQALAQAARRMRDGLFLMDGGAAFYTVFSGQSVRLGATVANVAPAGEGLRPGKVRVRVLRPGGKQVWLQEWPLQVERGETVTKEGLWAPPTRWPAGGYRVTTELMEGGRVVDRLQHELHVWTPPIRPDWVSTRSDGHFILNHRLWRISGVNYMPSSGIGQDDGQLFENWLSRAAYDPQIIERDLTHIQRLGLNAVSVFLYGDSIPSQNLLDLLRRCRSHHLRVNLSLRPGISNELQNNDRAEAERRAWKTFRDIIRFYHLAQNDTIFAYEIDWEPDFGRYGRQRRTDSDWATWIEAHYGTVAAAERAWAVPVPRDAHGQVTGPTGAQLQSMGGPETKMVAAYRRFLDDWLADTYGVPAQRIHALAPHQSVSFRMTGASDPLWGDGGESYQFEGLSRAVDFLSPESYGQIGHADGDTAVVFRVAYARSVTPHEPVIWAETGMSVWDAGAEADGPEALKAQGSYYARFYSLARTSGADGIFWWWYPGGFRVGENSDFGLINPDGTDRPATEAIRHANTAFLNAAFPSPPDTWLDYDRANHPDGAVGVFRALKAPFAAALEQGHHPGLRAHPLP